MSGRRVYVYYRIRPEDEKAVAAIVRALQSRRAEASIWRRETLHDGTLTLMEIYDADAAQQAEIEAEARVRLAPWIVGERHVEVFVPCA